MNTHLSNTVMSTGLLPQQRQQGPRSAHLDHHGRHHAIEGPAERKSPQGSSPASAAPPKTRDQKTPHSQVHSASRPASCHPGSAKLSLMPPRALSGSRSPATAGSPRRGGGAVARVHRPVAVPVLRSLGDTGLCVPAPASLTWGPG